MLIIKKDSRLNWNGSVVELMSYELNGKKWNELFEDEQELLASLKKVDVARFSMKYKGTSYIRSFHKVLQDGGELSAKQLTQLKRLASEVYTYLWNEEHTNYNGR